MYACVYVHNNRLVFIDNDIYNGEMCVTKKHECEIDFSYFQKKKIYIYIFSISRKVHSHAGTKIKHSYYIYDTSSIYNIHDIMFIPINFLFI